MPTRLGGLFSGRAFNPDDPFEAAVARCLGEQIRACGSADDDDLNVAEDV